MWCKLNSPVLHFQFTQKPSGDVTENLAERELERETEREREREGRGRRERWDEGRRKQPCYTITEESGLQEFTHTQCIYYSYTNKELWLLTILN